MVGIATLIAVPLGVATAIHIVEYGGRLARYASFLTDVMTGLPTIVTGAFVYALWVTFFGFSGLAGSIALALVMLPLVTRSAAEIPAPGAHPATRSQPSVRDQPCPHHRLGRPTNRDVGDHHRGDARRGPGHGRKPRRYC